MEELEKRIKLQEAEQAKIWRRWSKLRWLKEGDAPSKIFFATLRAKRAREEITALITEGGTKLEEEDDILSERHRYCSELYKQEPASTQDQELQKDVQNWTTKKVTSTQNAELIKLLAIEEIRKVVQLLKEEKAPSIDGMTAEAIRTIWPEAEADITDFVQTFWREQRFSWKQQTGVIRLIPKEGDRQKGTNWRPLNSAQHGLQYNK
ncbi:hypothetical protein R1flu_005771 [Riccia fluitans]|uniref:Uncharacterized protein n=1 Tax=Riccia fluitans TaxID=41844 RepID=A0ABD1YU42_9MARC